VKLLFSDPSFSFELIRTMGHAPYRGADIGECLVTAERIVDGDVESWYREWMKTARRVHAEAERAANGGHAVSARNAFLRASNYFRAAEFYLHVDPSDTRILETWRASRDTFASAAALLPHPAEPVEIPYEGTTLSGHLYLVDDSPTPRPTVIFHGGIDSTLEELYCAGAAAAIERGYNCLAFTGPGQGRSIREQRLVFRPDWERVVSPVIDFALTQPQIDARKIALLGWSYGGYLAPRAAAFEPRLAALIAWDGVYDNYASAQRMIPPALRADLDQTLSEDPSRLDKPLFEMMAHSTGLNWAFTHGMWVFGVDSPGEVIATGRDYHLRDVARLIQCPTLICEAADDAYYPGQPEQLFAALTCPRKDLVSLTTDQGAGEHCHVGAHTLLHQTVFDWLDDVFA
jgi:pimeloyl-ACP methyl ester carboxylesterase